MVDFSNFGTLSDYDAPQAPSGPPENTTGGVLRSGFGSGVYSTIAAGAGGLAAGAQALGADNASRALSKVQDFAKYNAQITGRSDLDQQTFGQAYSQGGVGGLLKKGAYTLAQSAYPLLATATGAVAGGEVAPLVGLGGEVAADVGFGARALAAAPTVVGGGVVQGVQDAGDLYDAAKQKLGGATRGDAIKSVLEGGGLGLLQNIVPGASASRALGLIGTDVASTVATRLLDHTVTNAAAGAVGSGVQSFAETQFDPNMSLSDRMNAAVEAAAGGAVFGGILGGALSAFHGKTPGQVSNEDIAGAVDGAIGGGGTPPAPQLPGPAAPLQIADQRTPEQRAAGPIDGTFAEALPAPAQVATDLPVPGRGPSQLRLDPGGQSGPTIPLDDRTRYPAAPAPDAAPEPGIFTEANKPATTPQEIQKAVVDEQIAKSADITPENPADPGKVEQTAAKNTLFTRLGDDGNQIAQQGRMRDWINQSEATSPPELWQSMQSELDAKSPVSKTAGFKKIAYNLGLTDEKGKVQTAADVDAMRQETLADPANTRQAQLSKQSFLAHLDEIDATREAAQAFATPPEVHSDASPPAPFGDRLRAAIQDVPGHNGTDKVPIDHAHAAFSAINTDAGTLDQFKDRLVQGSNKDVKLSRLDMPEQMTRQARDAAATPIGDDVAHFVSKDAPATAPANVAPVAESAPPTEPLSIKDQVVAKAQELTGGTGGKVAISRLRAALPDLNKADFESALRDVHGDDSDNTLTQNPPGARAGIDGVPTPNGKMHALDVEPAIKPEPEAAAVADPNTPTIRTAKDFDRAAVAKELSTDDKTIAPSSRTVTNEIFKRIQGDRDNAQSPTVSQRSAAPVDQGEQAGGVRGDGGGDQEGAAAQDAQGLRIGQQDNTQPVKQGRRSEQTMTPVERQARSFLAARAAGKLSLRQADVADDARRASGKLPDPIQTADAGTVLPDDAIGATPLDVGKTFAQAPESFNKDDAPRIMEKRRTDDQSAYPDMRNYHSDDAKADLKDLTSKLRPEFAKNVHLQSGFPEHVEQLARAAGIDLRHTQALYVDGKVYIDADNLRSREHLEAVVAHEVYGHMGVRQQTSGSMRLVTGADKDLYVDQTASMFDRAGGFDGFVKLAKQLGVWDRTAFGGAGVKGYFDGIDPKNLSSTDKAELMDELLAHAQEKGLGQGEQSLLQRFTANVKEAMAAAFRSVGLNSFADKVNSFGAAEVAKFLQDSRNALDRPEYSTQYNDKIDLASLPDSRLRSILREGTDIRERKAAPPTEESEVAGGVQRAAKAVGAVFQKLPLADKLPTTEIGLKVQKIAGLISSQQGLQRFFGKWLPEMVRHFHLDEETNTINQRFAQNFNKYNQAFKDFGAHYKEAGRELQSIMARATELKLDPLRPFSDHDHLAKASNIADLRAEHAKLTTDLNKFNQPYKNAPAGLGTQIYKDQVAVSRLQNHSQMVGFFKTSVDGLFKAGEGPKGFDRTSLLEYTLKNDLHNDAYKASDFFRQDLDGMLKGAKDFIAQNSKKAAVKDVDGTITKAAVEAHPLVPELRDLVDRYTEALKQQEESPYFHQGRQGDYIYSFHIKKGVDGNADPASTQAIADSLKGTSFSNLSVNTLNTNSHVFMKFETSDAAKGFEDHMKGLQEHIDPVEPSFRGQASDKDFDASSIPFLNKLVATYREKYANDPNLEKIVGSLKAAAVDALPNNSLQNVLQNREGKQGFSTDLIRNQEFRGQVAAKGVSSLYSAVERGQLAAKLNKRIQDLGRDPNISRKQLDQLIQAKQTFDDRNAAQAQNRVASSWLGMLRTAEHTFQVALSPAYAMMQVGQVATLGWPELAKKFGYAKAVGSLVKSLPAAGRVLAQVVKSGNTVSGGITPEVLARAGISKSLADHYMGNANAGKIELSSFVRSMGGTGPDAATTAKNIVGKSVAMANASATLSEVFARLVMSGAAKNLHDAEPGKSGHANALDYANHTLAESMLTWGSYDTPKLMSSGGPLGQVGPLAFQFHQFSSKMTEKLYYEMHQGFTAQGVEAGESQRFLKAHLVAVTLLAGSLGLPGAGYTAALLTKGSTLFNDGEAVDVEAHYRDFLASVLGKGGGEILAKGLPRYLGADMGNLGDDAFLPLQKLMEDRRKLEDAFPAYLAQAWGSGTSTALNIALGLRDVADGNIVRGMARGMPVSMRNIARAYQLSQNGYTNSQGEKLPIPVEAGDIIAKVLGMKTGAEAEYDEKAESIRGGADDRAFHSGVIKSNLARAIEGGDAEGQARWMEELNKYDADPSHAGEPIGPSLSGYLASRAKAVAYSQSTGLPLGTSPKNLPALNDYNY